MAKPDVEHYYSGDMVLKRAWDVEADALKIIPSEHTQFEIALDAKDGDSVQAVAATCTITQTDGAVPCGEMRRCMLYGTGTVEVSPMDEGDVFYPLSMSGITQICAKRVKVTGVDAHLVLQS